MKSSVNIGYVVFLSVVAALGGFLFGYDTAVISGTIAKVTAQFNLDTMSSGWYVGCALIGSIVGVLFAGILSDKLGRKRTMILSAILFSMSAIGCAVCADFNQLVVYRIVGGVGIGVVSIVSPLYISEVSVAQYRGRLVSLYQLAVTIGFLGAYLMNYQLLMYAETHAGAADNWFNWIFVNEVWRGMLGMETLPALLFFVIVFFIPESPRWLIVRNREERAVNILEHIYSSSKEALVQLNETKSVLTSEIQSEWSLLLSPGIMKAVIIGVCIAILGQFMGVNAVLYYGPSIFEGAGLSGGDSLFYQVLVGLVNTLTTVLALAIIDKVGRKKLVDALGGRFKEVIIGGAAMNPEVEEFFHRIKFPFTIGYGMTECAPLISYAPWNEFVTTSSGRVLDIMEARIYKENPDDRLGEIQVRGENVMVGYYKNPEATKEVFTEDGWLRTGDLGTLDEHNNLYIRGRSKTMILSSSGQNIFPEEIEARLNNMPFVLESLVIERNRKLVALVYADYEALDSLGLNNPENLKTIMDENLKNLNNSVAAYEKVSQIQLYPTEFEKTPKRSIKRYLYNSIAED